ncbi:MAG: MotA/TolQ/ExbB proton channel family protein [Deltaproteobacteria bacterium]|nr:MotA/TolQ/ExbB proton channel family protein [Deltaproteobacteria bacterium]
MKIVEKSKAVMLAMGAGPVMWLMIALSILSLAIILERGYFFYSIRDDLEALARDLARALRGGNYDDAKKRMEASPSAEAAVVVAGLAEVDRGASAAEEAMAGATALQRMKLERRLAYLGTLGNNAPFIGLFGTVIGIIQAFEKLGEAGKSATAASSVAAPAEVMASIAEALVATAIGLAVAIPAVAAYNYFQRMIKATVTNTDALSRVLLAHLKAEQPHPAIAAAAKPTQNGGEAKKAGDKGEKADKAEKRAKDEEAPTSKGEET